MMNKPCGRIMKGDGADNNQFQYTDPVLQVPNARSTADCLLGGITSQQDVVSIQAQI